VKFFSKLRGTSMSGVAMLQCRAAELEQALAALSIKPTFINAYVSPHLDIDQVARTVTRRFPGVPIMLCSTAGELCSAGEGLYCSTGDQWDRVVLQCFDASLIAQASVVAVPLGCEDIRRGDVDMPVKERVARIARNIQALQVGMEIDHRDTLACVLFDGLSASESFFMEALYDSGRFPCLFVGGSAGGKFDFRNTWLHDGTRRLENHALIAFLKVARGTRFGVLKSQNFVPDGPHFPVLHASLEQRYVSEVIDADGRVVSFIDALCAHFRCAPRELEAKLADFPLRSRSARRSSCARWCGSMSRPGGCISTATSPRATTCCWCAGPSWCRAPKRISGVSWPASPGAGGRHPQRLHPAAALQRQGPRPCSPGAALRPAGGLLDLRRDPRPQPQPDPHRGVLLPGAGGRGLP
jgi:hypothetical protein